jgi:hypothetical protein
MATNLSATASQVWAILSRHARDDLAVLRIQELCRDKVLVLSLDVVYSCSTTSPHPDSSVFEPSSAQSGHTYGATFETGSRYQLGGSTRPNYRRRVRNCSGRQPTLGTSLADSFNTEIMEYCMGHVGQPKQGVTRYRKLGGKGSRK